VNKIERNYKISTFVKIAISI